MQIKLNYFNWRYESATQEWYSALFNVHCDPTYVLKQARFTRAHVAFHMLSWLSHKFIWSMQFLLMHQDLHEYSQAEIKRCEIWWMGWPGMWTSMTKLMSSHHRICTQSECLCTLNLWTVYLLSLTTQGLLLMNWTQNKQPYFHNDWTQTTYHVVECTRGMGESTTSELVGALYWNQQTSSSKWLVVHRFEYLVGSSSLLIHNCGS
jgi:hypothetical protein